MDVHELIRNIKMLDDEINGLVEKLKVNKAKAQDFFDRKGIKHMQVGENTMCSALLVSLQERCYVDYDAEKLKEKLPKELFNKSVDKAYIVSDIEGLKGLMKDAGIKPAEFLKFIDIKLSPNRESMKQLYALGELTKQDLSGCYTARITKSLIIKEKKR